MSKRAGTILKLQDWPETDRRLWLAACAPMDVLDGDGGSRCRHSPLSNRTVATSYGRWLAFLGQENALDPDAPPVSRITPDRVKAYVADLKARGNATYTILNRIQDLASFALAVDPGFDRRPLTRLASRVNANGGPKKDKRARMAPTDELYGLGLRLMEAATTSRTARLAAHSFRDGLIIAFLALRPLRLHNLTHLQLGASLQKVGDVWVLNVSGEDTKNGRAFEACWPESLRHQLETYLTVHRPVLAALPRPWAREVGDALWLVEGAPMRDGRMNTIICERTCAAFGRPINPHLFRHAAATTWAIEDPVHVRGAASLLGDGSQRTIDQHYQLAQGLEAQRDFHAGLRARRSAKRPKT